MNENSDPFVSLEHAFNQILLSHLLNYRSCLVTIGNSTVAIFRPFPGFFKIFDPHSTDSYEMPGPFGKCILTSVDHEGV